MYIEKWVQFPKNKYHISCFQVWTKQATQKGEKGNQLDLYTGSTRVQSELSYLGMDRVELVYVDLSRVAFLNIRKWLRFSKVKLDIYYAMYSTQHCDSAMLLLNIMT